MISRTHCFILCLAPRVSGYAGCLQSETPDCAASQRGRRFYEYSGPKPVRTRGLIPRILCASAWGFISWRERACLHDEISQGISHLSRSCRQMPLLDMVAIA